MPNKPGMGGHGKEAYDPNTGKFIEDGKENVRHPNPIEAQKIAGGVSPLKIQRDSAAKMSDPTPNLGDYAKRDETLHNDFGVEQEDWSDSVLVSPEIVDVLSYAGIELPDNVTHRIKSTGKMPNSILDKLRNKYSDRDIENMLSEAKR